MNRRQRRADAKLGPRSSDHCVTANADIAPTGRLVADLFEAGFTRQQAGQLVEAETYYRQVLAIQPDHADALHLLGLIAHQFGRPEVAVELIRRAIKRNGSNAAYFANLGTALRAQGKLEKAIAACRQAIRIQPDFAEAHYNLANVLRAHGKLKEAVDAFC